MSDNTSTNQSSEKVEKKDPLKLERQKVKVLKNALTEERKAKEQITQ